MDKLLLIGCLMLSLSSCITPNFTVQGYYYESYTVDDYEYDSPPNFYYPDGYNYTYYYGM